VNVNRQRVITSWGQKGLARLGDRAAIAVLKILEPAELRDPGRIKASLQIVRQAFAQPQLIDSQFDKEPKVILFLLQYMKTARLDTSTQAEIGQTEEFVKQNTTRK
jgi:hypothetical protein